MRYFDMGFGGLGGRTKSYDWAGHDDANKMIYIEPNDSDREIALKLGMLPKSNMGLKDRDGYTTITYFYDDEQMVEINKLKQKEIIDAMDNKPSDDYDDKRLGFNL